MEGDVPREVQDVPSSAGGSFRTFQSEQKGYQAPPLVEVLEATREFMSQRRVEVVCLFGDLSRVSNLDRAERWSSLAATAAAKVTLRVHDPLAENKRLLMQAVHNNVLAVGFMDDLHHRTKEAECKAWLFELKCQKAEEEVAAERAHTAAMEERFKEFCTGLKQTVFPWVEEGHALLKEFGADSIADFIVRIQEKIKVEVDARKSLAEELAKVQAENQQLVSSYTIKKAEMEVANSNLQEMEAANSELKRKEAEQREENEKLKADLSAAQELLKVRVFTKEQYEEGNDNGFNVARRLAFHVDLEINWDQVEECASVPNHPHMRHAHPAKKAYLARIKAEEDDDDPSPSAEA